MEKHLSMKLDEKVNSFNSELFSLTVEGRPIDFNSVLVSVKTAFQVGDELPNGFEISTEKESLCFDRLRILYLQGEYLNEEDLPKIMDQETFDVVCC